MSPVTPPSLEAKESATPVPLTFPATSVAPPVTEVNAVQLSKDAKEKKDKKKKKDVDQQEVSVSIIRARSSY